MDTSTTSRSPTTVITANGEVQTHEDAIVYVKELDIFLTIKVLEDTPAILSLGGSAMNTDTHTSGSTVKKHISLKTVFEYNAIRRTSFPLWLQACQIRLLDLTHQPQGHFQNRGVIAQHLLPARLHHLQ